MDPEERVAEAMKGLLVEYSQQSARLAVQVRGNEYRRAAAAGGGGGFLLSPGERERLRAGSGLELVIVPVMEGDQVVSSSASAEVLVSPLVEGEVRVVPAVERRRWRRQAAAEEWEEIDPETKYRGVRVRFGTRYVAEIHNPTGAGRLWLGTFDTAEQGRGRTTRRRGCCAGGGGDQLRRSRADAVAAFGGDAVHASVLRPSSSSPRACGGGTWGGGGRGGGERGSCSCSSPVAACAAAFV